MKTRSTKQKGCSLRLEKVAACAGLIWLFPLAAWAGGTVTNCTEADFLAAAAGGGTVTFACDGTITLSQTFTNNAGLVLDGTGHQIRISGSNTVRLFWVAANVSFTAVNLTLSDGFAGSGAAILNFGGNVNLRCVELSNNVATTQAPGSSGWSGLGGAILNVSGWLDATNCFFANNRAYAEYSEAGGGAIRNEVGGQVNLEQCAFIGNSASATNGMPYTPQPAAGGAIDNRGALVVRSCTLAANSATGGQLFSFNLGMPGGSARGGAVFNGGDCTVYGSTCSSNVAAGGSGGLGSSGTPVGSQAVTEAQAVLVWEVPCSMWRPPASSIALSQAIEDREAMVGEAVKAAAICRGIRCMVIRAETGGTAGMASVA